MPQTGATRYQKFLKSEKSKTKLKAKKDLPKGTNVTKTNFKVKKIVIKEQLKKHSDTEAVSSRKLNVKELLSRLNHFNIHSKTDALEGLKELIGHHPQALLTNLGQLIHGVTPMVLNIEKVVRRESLKVLHLMLSNVHADKMEPFFDIMSTYLRSAMTHIDSRIQEDSLLFLDLLLSCNPDKMAQDFHKIIPNFLDMISKLRVDSKPGRTLTVNLDSQITSVKWRVKVLHRLQQFLNKFVEYHKICSSEKPIEKKTHVFDSRKMNFYSLFNPEHINYNPFIPTKMSQDEPTNEIDKFSQYIDTLMPLLFETWLEVCPKDSGKNIETVVSEDAAILLRHTLEVISLLWQLIQHLNRKEPTSKLEQKFSQKYRQQYAQHFLSLFPYVTNVRQKQQKASDSVFEDTITDPKLVVENLEICYLFIVLNPFVNIKHQSAEISSVLSFVEKTFNQNAQSMINDVVEKILNTIFTGAVTNWSKSVSIIDSLFKKMIWAYFNTNISSTFKQKLFSLLCNISLNNNLAHFHSSEAYEMWLNNLPDILLDKSIDVKTIDILHKFAVCSNKTFNVVIKPKLLQVMENLPNIIVSDNDVHSYYKLFSLLYWIKSWDVDSLNLLEKQLLEGVYKSDHAKYIFDTLKLRSSEAN